METFDPDALLADARARGRAASARARAALDRLGQPGAETAARYVDKSDRPFSRLFDGAHPDDVIRDSRTIKKVFDVWRTSPRARRRGPGGGQTKGTSTIQLPSGKSFRYHHDSGEVTR